MDAIASILSLLFGLGCLGVLPLALAAAALIHALRSGADWYWVPVILFFPVVGSVAYFAVTRTSVAQRVGALSPAAVARQMARRRLRALEVQLGHWRGPGVLAEAGECLYALGRHTEAEALFREALEAGADPADVDLGLAQAVQAQGRFAEAIPLLERQTATAPSYRQAELWLQLGRCRDETGDADGATDAFREHLQRGSSLEAKARLARLLLRRGERAEAERLVAEVRSDAHGLPRYLRREHGRWIRAARGLRSGGEKLPRPRYPSRLAPGKLAWVAGIAVAVVVLLALAAAFALKLRLDAVGSELQALHEEREEVLRRLERLDEAHPWPHGDDLATVDLTEDDVAAYLRVRRRLAPFLAAVAEDRRRLVAQVEAMADGVHRGGLLPALGAMGDGFEMTDAQRSDVAFRAAVQGALAAEDMSPTTLDHLAALVDWRFLGRDDLLVLGLSPADRADYVGTRSALRSAQESLDHTDDPAARRALARTIADLEAELTTLETTAQDTRHLSPTTRTLLESHREALESLPPEGLRHLPNAIDDELLWI